MHYVAHAQIASFVRLHDVAVTVHDKVAALQAALRDARVVLGARGLVRLGQLNVVLVAFPREATLELGRARL